MNKTKISRFIGSLDTMSPADIIIAGIPYDCTSSFRSGSRFASREIRSYSEEGIEDFSFSFGKGLDEIAFYDAGDMEVIVGNPETMVDMVRNTALELIESGEPLKRLVAIGGEHLVTYPLYLAAQKYYENITILHLDAHADLREGYAGDTLSHASVMKLCLESGCEKLIQFGIRSGTREEYQLRMEDSRIIPAQTIEDIVDALDDEEEIYLSVDVDFFDPGVFPGTGTPEAGGASFDDYISILKKLRSRGIKIMGADIVELAPEIDPTKISTIFAAKLLRETLIVMGN